MSDMISSHYEGGISSFPPLAVSLNFHMKLSNARSHDSKINKIAVKVNHPQKVKSTKNKEVLYFGKIVFTVQNKIQRTFRLNLSQKESQKCPNLES